MSFIRLAFCLFLLCTPSAALSQSGAIKGVPIFKTPRFAEEESLVRRLTRADALDLAGKAVEGLIQRYPRAPHPHVTKAEIAARRDDAEAAIAALQEAASLGYADIKSALAAPIFQPLADDERMQALLAAPPAAADKRPFRPALVKGGVGVVTEKNTRWNPDLALLEVAFHNPPTQRSKPVSRRKEDVIERLHKLVRRGRAAGNIGDFYDNRDAGHSSLTGLKDVQLTVAAYSDAARAAGLHYGLNQSVIFDGVAFGNSSTARTGPLWRSQPRQALTTPLGPLSAWRLYDNNHIYVYPEHRDHDPVAEKGHGDVFPANTPLMLISKGSSGSDRRFLQAIQVILAGFKPRVKALLTERRLIAPTVQQIIRRGMTGIATDEDYLGAAAHPTVFDQKDVDIDRMLDLANALEVGAVPPRAQIVVVSEEAPKGPFAAPLPEELFTTPDAIARVWRGAKRVRRYTLSAAASWDANEHPLTFTWRVLRGDPAKVRIAFLKADASEVEVTIAWQDGMRSPKGLKSSRIDIALFAHNGAEYSAPAMFSLTLPTHQTRVYSDDTKDDRPLRVAYLRRKNDRSYVDPVIWPRRNWNDDYAYDEEGVLLGWTRRYRKGKVGWFTRHGLKVIEEDALGRPTKAEAIRFELTQDKRGHSILTETPWERTFEYRYESDVDRLGQVVETTGQ